MKAPEKIYIQSFNTSEEDAKFDKSKMFFDDIWTEEPETGFENIEYTRTDAFIEKAADYIKKDMLDNLAFQGRLNRIEIIDGIIEKFIKAMKGEQRV